VLGVARVAGIMAAKKTAELIPLCHPLALSSKVTLDLAPDEGGVTVTATVRLTGPDRRGNGGADRRLGRAADRL
jgi:cyclic pyranopterin phosphate synthase